MLSFDDALDLLLDVPSDDTIKSPSQLTVAYDMGWQRRSTGRRYNSMSGIGVLVGNETNKILNYGVRQKDCRICTLYRHKNATVPYHDCHANFQGSMEADLAAELVNDMARKDVTVVKIIIDDDSTTLARLRLELDHDVKKRNDNKHVTKSVQCALYKIDDSSLTKDSIKHIVRCVSYAIQQNRDKPEDLMATRKSIIPHTCGDHSKCGSCCRFHQNPDKYRHRL